MFKFAKCINAYCLLLKSMFKNREFVSTCICVFSKYIQNINKILHICLRWSKNTIDDSNEMILEGFHIVNYINIFVITFIHISYKNTTTLINLIKMIIVHGSILQDWLNLYLVSPMFLWELCSQSHHLVKSSIFFSILWMFVLNILKFATVLLISRV